MKKLLLFIVLILGVVSSAFAEEKTYKNGEITAYLSNDRVEVVDNNKNVCIVVSITPKKNSVGQWVFDMACGNKMTKNVTKNAMRAIIAGFIDAAAASAGTDGTAIKIIATSIAGDAYDWMCEQFSD